MTCNVQVPTNELELSAVVACADAVLVETRKTVLRRAISKLLHMKRWAKLRIGIPLNHRVVIRALRSVGAPVQVGRLRRPQVVVRVCVLRARQRTQNTHAYKRT